VHGIGLNIGLESQAVNDRAWIPEEGDWTWAHKGPRNRASVCIGLKNAALGIAQVGMRLSQVPDCIIGRRRFGPVGCGLIMGRNRGLIRLYAERRTERLLGAAMIGPRVGHLAHRIAWSIGQGHTVQRMLCLPCATSVIEEALHDALRQAVRRLRVAGSLQIEVA